MSSGDRQMQNSCWLEEDLLSEHDLFGKPPDTFPDHALLGTQYKARVPQITLLFPHDSKRCNVPVRRKVPITTTRSSNGNGQAMPGRRIGSEVHPDCRNVISPPSAAELACPPAWPDKQSRRRARCPSGYRQSPSR